MATVGTGVGFSPDITQPLDNRTVVADQAARLALPAGRIFEGLLVFQEDTNELFVLKDGSDASIPTNWEIANSHISGSNFTITGSIQQTGSDSHFISKVGIGTMLPTAQLHVSGVNDQTVHIESPTQDAKVGIRLDSLRANSNTMGGTHFYKQDSITYLDTDEAFIIRPNAVNAFIINGSTRAISFVSSSSDNAVQNTYFFGDTVNKRIGIGTTSPQRNLHIVDTSNGNVTVPLRVHNDTTTNNSGVGIDFGVSTTNSYVNARIQATREDNDASGELAFLNTSGNSGTLTERMRIDANGNVGIGTASPSEKLHIMGNLLISGADGDNSDIKTEIDQHLRLLPNGDGHVYIGSSTNGANLFHYSRFNNSEFTSYIFDQGYYNIDTNEVKYA